MAGSDLLKFSGLDKQTSSGSGGGAALLKFAQSTPSATPQATPNYSGSLVGGKNYPTQSPQPNFLQQTGNVLGGVVNNAVKSWQQAPLVGGLAKDIINTKPNEGIGAPIGRALQNIPSPNLGTRGKDIFKSTETETKIVDFLSNMPSAILNSWGKSLETLSTPEGKKKLKEDAKRLPQTAQEVKDYLSKKEWGQAMQTAFDNSAVSVGMDVADFIPITWLGKAGLKGINASLRKTGQQIVKEGVEEAGFKTVKEVFEPVKVPEVPKPEVKPADITKGLEGGGGKTGQAVESPATVISNGEKSITQNKITQEIQTTEGQNPQVQVSKTETKNPQGQVSQVGEFQSRVLTRLKEEHPEITDNATYEGIKLKEDAQKAVELLVKDKQKAYRIATGQETSTEVTSTAVNIALSEKAMVDGEWQLASELIKKRSFDQTRRGQEIVAEKGSVTDNSTSRYVKELLNARLSNTGDRFFSDIRNKIGKTSSQKKALDKIDIEVKKAQQKIINKRLDINEAQKLLDQITCK